MSETPGGDREATGNGKGNRTGANPFVGPNPFGTRDPLYGRDREVRALRDLLISQRIVVFYSPSGAGKTSLIDANAAAPLPAAEEAGDGAVNDVHAGLRWEMARARFRVLPVIRINQAPKRRPKAEANRYVLSALLSLEENHPSGKPRDVAELADMSLAQYLAEWPRAKESPLNDLLIFDQFEELLTLDPTDRDAKEAFLTQVREVLRDGDRWALFSLREDHLGGLDPYAAEIPTRLTTSYRLDLLVPEAAKLAMQNPAERSGVEFPEDAARKLLDDLRRVRVSRPGDSSVEQPGLYVEPVYLQVVCRRLWDLAVQRERRIDHALVAEVGAVDDALEHFYATAVAEVVAETGVPERTIRRWFEEQLITGNGIRNQVIQEDEQAGGLATEAVDALVAGHLVRREPRRGVPWLELAHDRLIPPILANNNDWSLENLNSVQQAATAWDNGGRQSGFLLPGDALTLAETWAAEQGESLTDVERAFLDASRGHRNQLHLEETEKDRDAANERAAEQTAAAHRIRRWTIAAVVLALVAGVVAAVAINRGIEANLQWQVSRSQLLAKEAEDELNRSTGWLLAAEALEAGHTLGARQAVLSLIGNAPTPPLVWRRPIATFDGGAGEIRGIAFNEDSKIFASVNGDGALDLWSTVNWTNRDPRLTATTMGTPRGVAYALDGTSIATAGSRGVELWNALSLARPTQVSTEDVTSVVFSPDGEEIVYGSADGRVWLYDIETEETTSFDQLRAEEASRVNAVAYSRSGWIAAGRQDGTITVWHRDSREEPREQPPASRTPASGGSGRDGAAITSLAFDSNKGIVLAVGDSNGVITRWSVTPQSFTAIGLPLQQGGGAILSVAFNRPLGNRQALIAAADRSGTIALWGVVDQSGPVAPAIPAPIDSFLVDSSAGAWSVAFSPDDAFLVVGDGAGAISLWSRIGQPLAVEPPSQIGIDTVAAVAWFPDDQRLAAAGSVGQGGIVRLCEIATTPMTCRTFAEPKEPVQSLAFSRRGDRLAWGDRTGAVSIKALNGAQDVVELPQANGWVETLAFIQNDRALIVGLASEAQDDGANPGGGSIVVWDLSTPGTPAQREQRPSHVTALATSPNGSVVASFDQEASLWSIDAGRIVDRRPLPSANPTASRATVQQLSSVRGLAFDATGTHLAAAGGDGIVWDVSTRHMILSGQRGMLGAQSIAFAPDGLMLASGSNIGEIRLWDVEQGARLVGDLGKLPVAVVGLAWSDPETLIAVDARGTVLKLSLETTAWQAIACQAAGRTFTGEEVRRYFETDSPEACLEQPRQAPASPGDAGV